MLNPGPDKPAVPDEIRHSDFYQKLSDVFGLVERDFWSGRSWKSLANALRREALMCMVYDTASHEVQIEAILKCYFESKVPRLIHLATKFAEVLIKQEKEGRIDGYWGKQEFFINYVLRIGYMAMIANAIEKEILHEDIDDLLDKFREEGVQYQLNPLLETIRFSFFKEELFGDTDKGKKSVRRDILDHVVTVLSDEHPIMKDLKKLCEKTFHKQGDRHIFWPERLCRREGVDSYIVEFSFGYNGGMPDPPECDDDKNFDHKWIHYVKQIALFMETMYSNGYVHPRLVWIEDPDHSDVYSCYITFSTKKD